LKIGKDYFKRISLQRHQDIKHEFDTDVWE